jgi:general secretion pathway protein C
MTGVLLLLLASALPTDLTAVGVVVAEPPGRSVAILVAEGRTRIVPVGEGVFGGRLVDVSAERVVLEFQGERVVVGVTGRGEPSIPASPPVAPRPAPEETPEATAARVMSRDDVQKRLGAEMNRILSETALRPVTEDGRVVGVKLTRIAQDSLLTEAGLRAGDVLTSINGTEIDGMATLIGLWPRLQGASELSARVLRDGRPFSISLSLQ